jgi:hypothetical protein
LCRSRSTISGTSCPKGVAGWSIGGASGAPPRSINNSDRNIHRLFHHRTDRR